MAEGPHDFRFRLYDAFENGAQQGSTLCVDNIAVVNGRFSIPLDFGPQVQRSEQFLEIKARADTGSDCSNVGGFVLLSPGGSSAPRRTRRMR